jgi:hypothetical protein
VTYESSLLDCFITNNTNGALVVKNAGTLVVDSCYFLKNTHMAKALATPLDIMCEGSGLVMQETNLFQRNSYWMRNGRGGGWSALMDVKNDEGTQSYLPHLLCDAGCANHTLPPESLPCRPPLPSKLSVSPSSMDVAQFPMIPPFNITGRELLPYKPIVKMELPADYKRVDNGSDVKNIEVGVKTEVSEPNKNSYLFSSENEVDVSTLTGIAPPYLCLFVSTDGGISWSSENLTLIVKGAKAQANRQLEAYLVSVVLSVFIVVVMGCVGICVCIRRGRKKQKVQEQWKKVDEYSSKLALNTGSDEVPFGFF